MSRNLETEKKSIIFNEIKKIFHNISECLDEEMFLQVNKEVNKKLELRNKIKELANNKDKYYIYIIEECITLIKNNNPSLFQFYDN